MPNLTYTVAQFLPFTKIVSADVNQYFTDIKTLLNTTKLDSTNIQLNGLTRDRLAAGTVAQVCINDPSTGNLSSEAQLAVSRGGLGADFSGSLSTSPGAAIVINPAGSALMLGSPSQPSLTESFSGVVSTLTAAAAISANDACCVDVGFDVSGNSIYRIFKADNSIANRRRSFLGFAQAAATVTAGVYTWTASANFVTSNSIAYSINGRSYATAFTTDNATTLQAVATQIATDPDVSGAVSNGSHVITITGKGGLTIFLSGSIVTGGASQATIVFATTTIATGQNVLVQCFGPLAGFTSLTTTSQYYLGTAGAIAVAPTDTAPIQVGQALSSTVLFISSNSLIYQFGTPAIFVRSHGSSTNAVAGGTQDVEHFNFSSWAAGTSSALGVQTGSAVGDHGFQGFHHVLDGRNAAGSDVKMFQRYNKTAWATLTNRATVAVTPCPATAFNGFFYGPIANASSEVDKWNGSAWGSASASSAIGHSTGIFVQGGLIHIVGGAVTNLHYTLNASDAAATATASPSSYGSASGSTAAGGYYCTGNAVGPTTFQWTGSSWGSAVNLTFTPDGTSDFGTACGYNAANNFAYVNGGSTASVAINTTAQYNSTSWAGTTTSTNSRSGPTGSVI